MWSRLPALFASPELNAVAWWVITILVSSVIAFGMLWLIICLLPEDFFLRSGKRPHSRHPMVHLIWVGFRNVIGYILLGIGLIFVVFPGPGMPWLLIGLVLVDLPGKRKMQQRMLRMPSVHHCLNWLRARGGRCALLFPGEPPPAPQDPSDSE